jgi:predicted DNA-binding transcriptional regulator AlpA
VTAPLAYKLKDAAEAVGQSQATLRRAIHATDPTAFPPPLRAKSTSRGFLILATELDRWLGSLPDA